MLNLKLCYTLCTHYLFQFKAPIVQGGLDANGQFVEYGESTPAKSDGPPQVIIDKSNILIMGPTGSGKTHIVQV